MIEAYKRYKDWWIEHEAKYHVYATGCTNKEVTFERHLNQHTIYELMETLVDWTDNLEVPMGN